MKALNPIEKSKFIKDKYKQYLLSSFQFQDERLQLLYKEELEHEELFKGPYVALNGSSGVIVDEKHPQPQCLC